MPVDTQTRRHVAKDLFHSEFFLRNPAVVLLIDPSTGAIVDANDAAVAFYGYPQGELITMRISDLNTLPEAQLSERMAETVRDLGKRFRFTHRTRLNGLRDVDVFSSPMRVRGRSILCSIIHDVSELREKEDQLRFGERFMRQFVDEVPAAVAMFDMEMRYLLTSSRWIDDLGLPDKQSHIGKRLYDLVPNMPDHWIDAHRRGLAGERLTFDLEEVPYPDGSTRWVQWGVTPWHDQNGLVGGILIYTQDQTLSVQADRLQSRIIEERTRQQIRVEAGEAERRRISRELHDGLGQLLTAARLNLDVAHGNNEAIEKVRGLLEQGIREIRHIAHELRPSILDDFGLAPALRTLCAECSNDRLRITFRERIPGRLPTVVESAVYRICQEALTNIARHSGATNATLDAYVQDRLLHVVIQDDGVGIPTAFNAMNGIGMINMRERAEMLGGSLYVESTPGNGTDIIVEVPIP